MSFSLDFVGAILSLLCTIFLIRAHRIAWIFGFFAAFLNIILYTQKGLLGQVCMECVYLATTLYGWRQWSPDRLHQQPPITQLSWPLHVKLLFFTILSMAASRLFFSDYTPSIMPIIDATIVTLALIAQWLLCRRIFECWHYLLIIDIIILAIQFERSLPFQVLLHLMYCCMAIAGCLQWGKVLVHETTETEDCATMGSFFKIPGTTHAP